MLLSIQLCHLWELSFCRWLKGISLSCGCEKCACYGWMVPVYCIPDWKAGWEVIGWFSYWSIDWVWCLQLPWATQQLSVSPRWRSGSGFISLADPGQSSLAAHLARGCCCLLSLLSLLFSFTLFTPMPFARILSRRSEWRQIFSPLWVFLYSCPLLWESHLNYHGCNGIRLLDMNKTILKQNV